MVKKRWNCWNPDLPKWLICFLPGQPEPVSGIPRPCNGIDPPKRLRQEVDRKNGLPHFLPICRPLHHFLEASFKAK